jgi:hypothetical protein
MKEINFLDDSHASTDCGQLLRLQNCLLWASWNKLPHESTNPYAYLEEVAKNDPTPLTVYEQAGKALVAPSTIFSLGHNGSYLILDTELPDLEWG